MHAMVNFMDDEIGEVVDLLKESIRIYFQWGSIVADLRCFEVGCCKVSQ